LYEFAKIKTTPNSLEFSKDGQMFATMGQDRQVRVFKFLTGKLHRKYDESLSMFSKLQKDEEAYQFKLDPMEFGKRITVERELDQVVDNPPSNVIFDESGHFILYPTMLGIKVVNLVTNKVARMLGKAETNVRFVNIALYQGKTTGSAVLDNLQANAKYDPTLFCLGYKKHRFYMFTKREPKEPESDDPLAIGRDILNERPTNEEEAMSSKPLSRRLGKSAVLFTSKGDIHIKLFSDECPKTVENFSVHSKSGYYNNCIFHRVIKGFMIQTGDPQGDGTGGTSIWGTDFEDEIVRTLRHDRAFTVSMANAGANTNGSQFFITTVACPSLDGKHTVFGRVTKGMDVVLDIEKVKTDKNDKPLEDIKIVSIQINFDQ